MLVLRFHFFLAVVCWLLLGNALAQPLTSLTDKGLAVESLGVAQAPQHPRAELLWVEQVQKEQQIKFSALVNGEWSDPVILFTSENSLTSPALGSSSSGDRLVIWTEQRRTKTVLQSMQQGAGSAWGAARIFTDTGRENYAASIVYDLNDQAWVFWSSTRKDLSEIFVATTGANGWSKPQQIHPDNAVPDILPVAALNRDGDIEVAWTQYSFAQEKYIRTSKTFSASPLGHSAEQNIRLQINAPVAVEDIELPSFLPDNALSALHFPTNKMIQSRPISGK